MPKLVAFVERYVVPLLSSDNARARAGHWSEVASWSFGDDKALRLFLRQHARENWPHDSRFASVNDLASDEGRADHVWCDPPLVSMAVRGGLPLDEVSPELRALQQALFTWKAYGVRTRVLWSLT